MANTLLNIVRVLFLSIGCFIGSSSLFAIDLPKNQNLETGIPSFIKNEGQWTDGCHFHFRSGLFQASFYTDRIVFAVANPKEDFTAPRKPNPEHPEPPNSMVRMQVWEIRYQNSRPFQFEAQTPLENKLGYARIHQNGKIIYPEQFESLRIRNLYDGVDVRFSSQKGVLKIDYIIKPGTIPHIAFDINGFNETRVDERGNILLKSKFGQLVDSIPHSFEQNNTESSVEVKYVQTGKHRFALQFPENFNNEFGTIVDPFYLDYSTYFYGNNQTSTYTYIYDVNVDASNNSYVTGLTTDKYPGKPGTYDTTLSGSYDAFLCKIPSGGGKPDYFIYLGGNSSDYGYAMATTESGDCYVTGNTYSTDFPITLGVFEPKLPSFSFYTSFITGIKTDGSALIYSTYIKGSCWVIDVNSQGQVYVAPYGNNPYTVTKDINPPGQVGGGFEANIIRLNSTGSAILNCVELKGFGSEYVYALTIDKKNQVYAAGWTSSDNLPVTAGRNNFGGFFKGGSWDGFLFKIDSAFTKFLISKYIGTSGYDYISAITVDDNEDIFVQGIAGANDLPAATNTFPGGSTTGWNGASFIMRIYKNGIFPRWTTYITNNTYAWRNRISVNAKNECVFAGSTTSTTLPTTSDAFQKTLKGGWDGYIGKLSIDGAIGYLSYFGGSGTDYFFAVQTRRIGCVTHILLGGYGSGTDYPVYKAWKSTTISGTAYGGRLAKWRDTLKEDAIDLGPDAVQCDRNYRILEAGNPGAAYLWQNGSKLSYFIVDKPGKYWVSATYGCGLKSDTITFSIAPSAKSHFPKDTLICDKYGLLLDARNDTIKGIKYAWNNGDTTRKIFADSSGKYKVGMWTPVCQWRYDSIQVTKQYKPIRGIWQKDTVLCKPFTFALRSGSDTITAAYAWNTLDSVSKITVDKAGLYNVNITNQCGTLQDTILINSDSIPTLSYRTDTLICDKDSFRIARKGFSKWTKITWNDGSKDSARTLTQAGTYTVNVSNSCKSFTDTIKLKMGKIPKPFTLGNMLWCDNLQLFQTVNDNSFANIRWSTGDTGRQLMIKDTGIITATAESICGTSRASFRVERGFSPVIKLGSDTIICNANSWLLVPKSINFLNQIQWENGSVVTNRNINNAGKYWATGTNNCGTITDTLYIAFLNSPKVKAPSDLSYCDFISPIPVLKATGSGGTAVYTWNTGESGLSIKGNTEGTYTVTGTNECGTDRDSVRIKVFASPKPDLGIDTAFCGGFAYPLTVGNGYQLINWSNGSSASSITATQYGKYSVKVTDFNGCSGSDEITIGSNCKLIWYMPTAFSPNGDGKNDVWGPTIKDVQELKIAIYNRWGEKIWENHEGQTFWDGNYGSAMAPDGVYTWTASFRSNFKPYYKSGVLTLMR